MRWLEAEGFIRTEGVVAGYPYDFQRTTLTLNAMEAMKKVPDPLSPERTLLDGLKDAIGEGKKTAIQTLVSTSMTAIYQAVTNVV